MLPGIAPLNFKRGRVLKTIVLAVTGAGVFTTPSDWSRIGSKIECIGAGGAGARCANSLSAGGGGGAYAASSNIQLYPGITYNYFVGAGGIGLTTDAKGADGQDTWFGGSEYATSIVGAKGGTGGGSTTNAATPGGPGGLATSSRGQVKFSGGSGAPSQSPYGGAGGGAAGPNGAGNTGLNGVGGSGDAGFGGAGGGTALATFNAMDGRTGRNLSDKRGAGGGAGSYNGPVNSKGRSGGFYGGGGGGCRSGGTMAGGDGAPGVIIITYMGFSELILPRSFYANDFGQYPTGVAPADWTDQTLAGGFTWSVETVSGTVSGKAVRVTKSANVRRLLTWNEMPSVADGEALLKARAITTGVAGDGMANIAARITQINPSSTMYYGAALYQTSLAMYSSQPVKVVNGTQTYLASPVFGPTPNYAVNDWYYLRLRMTGSNFKLKLWKTDTPEPTVWTFDVTDTAIPGAGLWALFPGGASPNVEADYFALDTSGATIPVPI